MKAALVTHLGADAGVLAVLGTRVYPQILPQQPIYPAATFQVIGRARQPLVIGATDDIVMTMLQVDAYGSTSVEAEQGKEALKDALLDFSGDMGGIAVKRILLENEIDLSDVEPGLYRESMSFTIWHKDT